MIRQMTAVLQIYMSFQCRLTPVIIFFKFCTLENSEIMLFGKLHVLLVFLSI